mgnify:CR=1 FL=1|jgi:radical SAM-linked protein
MQTEYLTFIADYKVQDRFAYLSHQETQSFWQRVLVRAHVPLVYSQGFNPRPRLSLPLPRSVGVQSECERLCVLAISKDFCVQRVREAVEALLPAGCELCTTDTTAGKASFYPVSVTYQFLLSAPPDGHRQDHLQQCILQTQACEPIMQLRHLEKDRRRSVNIRPFLKELTVNDCVIRAVCAFRPEGTVRVDELMRWLNLTPQELSEPVRRAAVQWVSNTNDLQGEYNQL